MDAIDKELLSSLFIVKTNNDDRVGSQQQSSRPRDFQAMDKGLTVILGGNNLVHANNVVQINGDTLEKIADSIKTMPPETLKEISEPLGSLLQAIGSAVVKANMG